MKRIFGAKTRLLVSVLALVCILAVGGTMAYLFATSDPVTNNFSAAQLDTGINDTVTEAGKTVSITNKGDSPAWVRARLLVSGIDPAKVEIVSGVEQNPDPDKIYLVMPNTSEGQWNISSGEDAYLNLMNGDGWIYYTNILAGKTNTTTASTENLLQGVSFGEGVDPNTITITVTHESVLALGDTTGDIEPWKTAFNNPAG